MKKKATFDKYSFYKKSVQSPKEDIQFFQKMYKTYCKKTAKILREDFCGTFYVGWEWVKKNSKNKAIVIDTDKEPIDYGKKKHVSKLKNSEKARLKIVNENVLKSHLPKADIISVSNFSYFVLKEKKLLLKYFKNVKKSLIKPGIFIIDILGGPDCLSPSEEKVEHKGFNYYWELEHFDPISHQALFHIHFKRKGEKKRKKVFSYEWRMWSIPELKELLQQAGFSKIHIYWEQSDKDGEGNGIFKKTLQESACDTWLAYLVCEV